MFKNMLIKTSLMFFGLWLGSTIYAAVIPFYQRDAIAMLDDNGAFYSLHSIYGENINHAFASEKMKLIYLTISGVKYKLPIARLVQASLNKIKNQLITSNLTFSENTTNPKIQIILTPTPPDNIEIFAAAVMKARSPSNITKLYLYTNMLKTYLPTAYDDYKRNGYISSEMNMQDFIVFMLRYLVIHEMGHIFSLDHSDEIGETNGHVGALVGDTGSAAKTHNDIPIMFSDMSTYISSLHKELGRPLTKDDMGYSDIEISAINTLFSHQLTADVQHQTQLAYTAYMYGFRQLQFLGKTVKMDDNDPRLLPAYYSRYDVSADRADSGYPNDIDESAWPGISPSDAKHIHAAFLRKDGNKYYFFLDNGTYLRYNTAADKVDAGYPKQTSEGWSGITSNQAKTITAVMPNATGSKYYFFLKNNAYLRYDVASDKVDAGYPVKTNVGWPGITPSMAKKIDAAVINQNKSKYYLFMNDGSYLRYDIASDKIDSGYPAVITESNWPGVSKFKTQIKAVFRQSLSDRKMYFMMN